MPRAMWKDDRPFEKCANCAFTLPTMKLDKKLTSAGFEYTCKDITTCKANKAELVATAKVSA